MAITPDQIVRWAKAPSDTEEAKCKKTIERATKAIRAQFGTEVDIYLQGSYKNRTNVRQDSDVDILVQNTNFYFPNIYSLSSDETAKFNTSSLPANLSFSDFKSGLLQLLITEFGSTFVERKNKCIYVKSDQYRVNADIIPCYTLKRYASLDRVEAEGIAFLSDTGERIESFPKQHYENGAQKNLRTEGMYKSIVRILKNARNVLIETNVITKDSMPSFLLECVVWNIPDSDFKGFLYSVTRQIIAKIYEDMSNPEKSKDYAEVSDLKWLFRGTDGPTDIQKTKQFMHQVWNFIGY